MSEQYPDEAALARCRLHYRIARGVAVVVGVFCLVVAALLVLNRIQTHRTDPLNAEMQSRLAKELRSDPNNAALRSEVQALDLLARRAFFRSQTFARTGAVLLFGGLAIFLLAIRIVAAEAMDLPHPGGAADAEAEATRMARWAVAGSAFVLLIAAISATAVFNAELALPPAPDASSTDEPKPCAAAIEVKATLPTKEEIRANWTCFRGPGGIGIADNVTPPTAWDGKSGKGVLWKTAIPRTGFSSPVVWKGRIFLSTADAKVREVLCIDAATGKILWQHEAAGIPGTPTEMPEVTEDTGYAAATMTTDGLRVFAIFATGDLVCLDMDGKRLWARNLGVPENHYGHSSSLITHRNLLLVQLDQSEHAKLLGLDTATGKTVWETPRKDVEISWASPALVNTGARDLLLLNAGPVVSAYTPADGKLLWQADCMSGEVAPSPAFADGLVFFTNAYAMIVAIDVETGKTKWENEDAEFPDVSSPVANDRFVLIASSSGAVTCFDAKTGKTLWEQPFKTGFYASPILANGTVYLPDMKGVTQIFKPAGEFKLIAAPELGEPIVATPAFVGNRIYIRSKKQLWCIGGE